jgi:hypothetical protein
MEMPVLLRPSAARRHTLDSTATTAECGRHGRGGTRHVTDPAEGVIYDQGQADKPPPFGIARGEWYSVFVFSRPPARLCCTSTYQLSLDEQPLHEVQGKIEGGCVVLIPDRRSSLISECAASVHTYLLGSDFFPRGRTFDAADWPVGSIPVSFSDPTPRSGVGIATGPTMPWPARWRRTFDITNRGSGCGSETETEKSTSEARTEPQRMELLSRGRLNACPPIRYLFPDQIRPSCC